MVAKSTAPSPYKGPEPGTTDTDALRRSVPDDPIKVPRGLLPCEGCGIAHDGPEILSIPLGPESRWSAQFTRCLDCQRLDDIAKGDERTRNVLYALAVVGVPAPDDPAPLVPWLQVVGSKVPWLNPSNPKRDLCNPHPFAHVGFTQRARIKEAYLLAMRERVHVGAPSLHLPPPWGGACLFCGVASVLMAPLEVARKGGRENAARSVWRGVVAPPKAFGGRGPDMVDGFLCATCSEVRDRAPSVSRACARAFEEHAQREGIRVPTDLFGLYVDDHPFAVPGWASLGTATPNAVPWAHITVVDEAVAESA